MLTREDFAKRYAEGVDIRLHEILYPLLQGWDSVMIDADVEMGGSDQLFNNLVGREFQKEEGKDGQVVIVTPLLVGTDGVKKMSKSLGQLHRRHRPAGGPGRHVRQGHELPDALMESYYPLLTDVPMDEVRRADRGQPARREGRAGEARHRLAARQATPPTRPRRSSIKQFAKTGGARRDARVHRRPRPAQARAAAREGGARVVATARRSARSRKGRCSLDGQKVTDFQKEYTFDKPAVLKLGRKFARLKP